MVFGGIQKNSFIDFPGKISTVLFIPNCNFKCPYCHNASLVSAEYGETQEISDFDVFSFLENRKGLIDGVAITGGEPTLHPELPSVMKRIKSLGFPVKLDTNGTRPAVLSQLLEERLVDYIAMDIKTLPSEYQPFLSHADVSGALIKSIKIIKGSGIDYEFRATCVRPFITPDIAEKITGFVSGAPTFALQRFSADNVLDPTFFENKDLILTDTELNSIQKIIAPHVGRCIIR